MNSAEKVSADIAEWKKQSLSKTDLMIRIAEDEIGWPYAWGATGQLCTVANRRSRMANKKIGDGDKELIRKRCQVLNGSKSTCAGCKYFPEGNRTQMFDCIGFINQLLNYAEVDHYGAGCSIMWNRASNWYKKGPIKEMPETVCLVFQWVPGNDKKMQHIGLYIGNGYVIHCSKEVKKQKLSEYPWSHYGIPKDIGGDVPVSHKTVKRGDSGPEVKELQNDLLQLHYDLGPSGADGIFGAKTEQAVKSFQGSVGLKQDGVCGPKTWSAIEEALGPDPGPVSLYTVIIPHLTEQQANDLQAIYPDAEKRKEG